MIHEIPFHMVTDSSDQTCMAVFTKDWEWTNSAGKTWAHKKGDSSDGHTRGKYFRAFDSLVIAALNHDQDCVRANKAKSYAIRIQGDKDYKFNLIDLGASKAVANISYAGVRVFAYKLKISGRLK